MAIERVSIAIKGEKQRREKKQAVGEGQNIVVTKRLLVVTRSWQSKPFDCHMTVMTENFSIVTFGWQSKQNQSPPTCGDQKVFGCHNCVVIEFDRHPMPPIKFGHHETTAMYFGRRNWICWHFWSPSRNHQMVTEFV